LIVFDFAWRALDRSVVRRVPMIARRTLLVAALTSALLTPAHALDATPFPSFAYEGQQIRQAVITGVDTNGVTLIGRDAKGEERSLVIPLLAAQKMVLLNNKAKDEIEAALKQQRSAEEEEYYAKVRWKNAGQEAAFDLHEKTPQGWAGYLCEKIKVQASSGSRSSAQRTGFASGEYRPPSFREEWQQGDQMVLVRYYGKAMAEGERIITRAEEKGVTEAEVGGNPRTLRVYEVVGDDRSADAPAWQEAQ
jgi:hypothetical protein